MLLHRSMWFILSCLLEGSMTLAHSLRFVTIVSPLTFDIQLALVPIVAQLDLKPAAPVPLLWNHIITLTITDWILKFVPCLWQETPSLQVWPCMMQSHTISTDCKSGRGNPYSTLLQFNLKACQMKKVKLGILKVNESWLQIVLSKIKLPFQASLKCRVKHLFILVYNFQYFAMSISSSPHMFKST